MKTLIKKIDRNTVTSEDFKEAVEFLRSGQLVAFPTETVYGIGGNALLKEASKRIYEAKGRPADNPLIVHIASLEALSILAVEVPEQAYQLANAFWPGPLTMILKKSNIVPFETTGGLDTVAIRMPSDEIARRLLLESGLYLAAPSANRSGRPSTTMAEHVIEDLDGRVAMIIDGGAASIGLESTIVDLTGPTPMILRPGFITKEMLDNCISDTEYDPAVLKRDRSDKAVAKAPGMKYRHYAPAGELIIFEGETSKVIDAINQAAKTKCLEGHKVGVLATNETKEFYQSGLVKSIGSRSNEEAIAAHLFEVLREFDKNKIAYIFSESFEDNPLGQAIMNRLLKAAGYRVITCE